MTAKIITPNKLSADQIEIVDMIKELLALALEGKIDGVGLVGLRDGGFFSAWGGRNAPALNLGMDDLKDRILKAARESSDEQMSRRSSILRTN